MATAAPAATSTAPSTRKGLHIGLWVVQALLAFAFGMAGVMKSTAPLAELAKNMAWVPAVPAELVRFVGVSEFLGAVGLILPSALRIQPKLTPLAAAGLVVVMVLASGLHASRGEFGALPINAVLGGLAAFVAWGRFSEAPVAPRS